jgi:hypothetical protein
LYSHPDAFVVSNLLISGILMVGWTAFAALVTHEAAAVAGLWLAGVLYLTGLLSGVVACQVLGSFYSGQVYRFACLLVACAGFILFAVGPAAGARRSAGSKHVGGIVCEKNSAARARRHGSVNRYGGGGGGRR